jgi:hypothetical protein
VTSWLTDLDVDLWPPQAIPRWDTFGQGRLQRPVLGGDEQRVGPVKELAEQLSPACQLPDAPRCNQYVFHEVWSRNGMLSSWPARAAVRSNALTAMRIPASEIRC